MPTATIITIPGNPGKLRKNAQRIAYRKGDGFCTACKRPKGSPFVVESKVPPGVVHSVTDHAFAAGAPKAEGMVMVAVVAHWPTQWNEKGRAPGRPRGDVDAPVSSILDALAGILYRDDAQVAVLVAANAKAAKDKERIEVSVAPLSRQLLADLERETGLAFTTATLSLGQQECL